MYAMLHQCFSTLQTEILSTVTSDFQKQMIIIKSFNSVLRVNAKIAAVFLVLSCVSVKRPMFL